MNTADAGTERRREASSSLRRIRVEWWSRVPCQSLACAVASTSCRAGGGRAGAWASVHLHTGEQHKQASEPLLRVRYLRRKLVVQLQQHPGSRLWAFARRQGSQRGGDGGRGQWGHGVHLQLAAVVSRWGSWGLVGRRTNVAAAVGLNVDAARGSVDRLGRGSGSRSSWPQPVPTPVLSFGRSPFALLGKRDERTPPGRFSEEEPFGRTVCTGGTISS